MIFPTFRLEVKSVWKGSKMDLSDISTFFYGAIILILCAVASASIFQRKGRSKIAGFLLGLFLGPIGVVLTFVYPNEDYVLAKREIEESEDRFANGILKKCPYCAEYIKTEAAICHYCGRPQAYAGTFVAVQVEAPQASVRPGQNVPVNPVQNVAIARPVHSAPNQSAPIMPAQVAQNGAVRAVWKAPVQSVRNASIAAEAAEVMTTQPVQILSSQPVPNTPFEPVQKPPLQAVQVMPAQVQNIPGQQPAAGLPVASKSKRTSKKNAVQAIQPETIYQQYNPVPVAPPAEPAIAEDEEDATGGKKKNLISKLLGWFIYEQ
jgi:hypothetical protein